MDEAKKIRHMYYIYGSMPGATRRFVATIESEAQLLAYVRCATLSEHGRVRQFEKGSSLAGLHEFCHSGEPVTNDDAAAAATIKALPQYAGKFEGLAVRAPVPVGSLADIVFVTERRTSVAEVNAFDGRCLAGVAR